MGRLAYYASINGVPAASASASASATFSNKLGVRVSKSTVNVMKKAYLEKETDWFRGGDYSIS